MGRAPSCEKIVMKRGRWTGEEDETLTNYFQLHGDGSWRFLPKNAGLLRCGKSCRLRWTNYLRADLRRGNITSEEEETIVKLHTALGNSSVAVKFLYSGKGFVLSCNEHMSYVILFKYICHKNKRIKSAEEMKKKLIRCSRCLKMGHHNRATCNEPMTAAAAE